MTSTITPSTTRATFAIGSEQTAKRVVDLLTESFFEGQAAIAAFERPDGRWDITVHFAEPPDQASIRELVGLAAGDEVAQRHRLRHRRGQGLGQGDAGRTGPGPRRAVHRAWPARPRQGAAQQARHRDRGGAGVRHRPSRHHARLPAAARSCAEGACAAARARSRHRHRRARDRRGQGAARHGAGERHRSAVGSGRARQRPAQRHRRSGADDPRDRIFGAAIRARAGRSTWCWRISSPIRCGRWRRRWRGIWRHRRW